MALTTAVSDNISLRGTTSGTNLRRQAMVEGDSPCWDEELVAKTAQPLADAAAPNCWREAAIPAALPWIFISGTLRMMALGRVMLLRYLEWFWTVKSLDASDKTKSGTIPKHKTRSENLARRLRGIVTLEVAARTE